MCISVSDLQGIPETTLIPLYHRAIEAKKPQPLLNDPHAVRIVDQIDYDFSQFRFGKAALAHPIRAKICDRRIGLFLNEHSRACVVSLGAGLDTQYERMKPGEEVLWLDLDVPAIEPLWKKFFQETKKRKFIATSVFEEDWLEKIPQDREVIFIAMGLLMYFTEAEVFALLQKLHTSVPGSQIIFDTVSYWVSLHSQLMSRLPNFCQPRYVLPDMKWGINLTTIPTYFNQQTPYQILYLEDYLKNYQEAWGWEGTLMRFTRLDRYLQGAVVQLQL
ncbi:O-methyltransferase involved in polyketide biosynthesis [Planctomycetales bacterium 10988]|nr:O-methyltransferase involved in polyketide biosynthesis [Planctomycetales bacterium 10988]